MRLTKHFQGYLGGIAFGALLYIGYLLIQLPLNLWLSETFLPAWVGDRSPLMLFSQYWLYLLVPAFLIGTAIFYLRVLKNL